MEDYQTRQEQKLANAKKLELFQKNATTSLNVLSKTNAGIWLLRFLMHECCFTSPLMYETPEGVNTEVMIGNETKRRLYLSLRSYMDRETILRVELPDTKGETNA